MHREATRHWRCRRRLSFLLLLLLSALVGVATMQSESVGGVSAIPYYELPEAPALRVDSSPALRVDSFAIGGTDVTLSPTNGGNEPAVAVNPLNANNV